MKLTTQESNISLDRAKENKEFQIKNSAKAFTILSSGLYANKIKAIIRELSCNALDSHKCAGKVDAIFDVHLPFDKEPWFAVRDYGTGLSHDDVMNIYTTYFESTKTDSNDYIGALGLGSKSPFSYTNNFTVKSWKDGKMGIYTAYLSETGLPAMTQIESDTYEDESLSGIEVMFGVTDTSDFRRFRDEAREVFEYFTTKPNITHPNFSHNRKRYTMENIVPGCHLLQCSGYDTELVAIQGNIGYPVNINKLSFFSEYRNLFESSKIEMEFDIGQLDVAASREELSYCETTIANIKSRFDDIVAALEKSVEKELTGITSPWDLYPKICALYEKQILRKSVEAYINAHKLDGVISKSWRIMKATGKISDWDFSGDEVAIRAYYSSYGDTLTKRGHIVRYDKIADVSYNEYSFDYDPGNKLLVILNDTNTGVETRARYHVKETSPFGYKQVLIFSTKKKDAKEKEKVFKRILAKLDSPANVMYASALKKKPAAKRVKTVTSDFVMLSKSGSYSRTHTWAKTSSVDLTDTTPHYYIPVKGMASTETRFSSNIKDVMELMDNVGIASSIYGVRKGSIKEVEKLTNWVNVYDYLKKELHDAKYVSDATPGEIANKLPHKLFNRTTAPLIASRLDATHPLAVLLGKKDPKAARVYNRSEQRDLARLARTVGETIDFTANSDPIRIALVETELKQLYNAYPMLKYVSYSHSFTTDEDAANAIIDYVISVDVSNKMLAETKKV